MSENSDKNPSLPEKRKSDGRFQKGVCPNKKGRPLGPSKKTKFLQIMTGDRQKKALKVLDQTLKAAEEGDAESRKLVLEMLKPFVKREAEQEGGGGGDKRPVVNVIVNQTEGRQFLPPPGVRVIDVKK